MGRAHHKLGLLAAALGLLGAVACSSSEGPAPAPSSNAVGTTSATPATPSTATSKQADAHHPAAARTFAAGDATRGRALAGQFECNRCHDGLDIKPIQTESHCVRCHQDVMAGRFKHKPDNARWQKNVAHLTAVPSLAAAGQRLRYDWLVGYLLDPHELRPALMQDMPRLALSQEQAQDIASYVMAQPNAKATPAAKADTLAGADAAAGKALLNDKGCFTCHTFSGSGAAPAAKPGEAAKTREDRAAVMLAPDLRHARDRLQPAAVVGWLNDPQKIKPGTLMPKTPMSDAEARNIAAFILQAKLTPLASPPIPKPLPLLTRKVAFAEVKERVLDKTCRHCHGDPDDALGDGGPGNTGGFGFKGRGLNLTSYARTNAGYLDDDGERQSVFKPLDGTPRIVAAMLARHQEVAGKPNPAIRGMPMGLPPVPLKDIQLFASWVDQGRPR